MSELKQVLDKYLNNQLIHMIISNPRNRDQAAKINLRPVMMKNNIVFQASEYQEKKVFHKNYSHKEAALAVLEWMEQYRQLEISSQIGQVTMRVSKKGKVIMYP